jgi:hypothetical protein
MSETTDTRTRHAGTTTGTGSRKSSRATKSPEERAAEVEALAEQLTDRQDQQGNPALPQALHRPPALPNPDHDNDVRRRMTTLLTREQPDQARWPQDGT